MHVFNSTLYATAQHILGLEALSIIWKSLNRINQCLKEQAMNIFKWYQGGKISII